MKPQGQYLHRVPNNQQPKQEKNNGGTEVRDKGDKRSGTQEEKKSGRERVKHSTKAREHQVNCLVQRVEDKGKKGGNKGHPSSHLCGAHKDRG